MRVNILQLRTFYAIAMEGSFSQAARRLNLSQSTLSKQLKAFEDRHQISIFNGRTPPLKLTPAGEALMASVKSLFATIEDIEGLLGDHDAPERSIIRLAADTPSTGAGLANLLKTAFPQSVLQVRIENARDSFERFRSGQADLAVICDPPVHQQFQYVPVIEDRLVVAMAKTHPLAQARAIDVEALGDSNLLLREPTSRTRAATLALLAEAQVEPRGIQELHTREMIREAIALNMGMSLFYSMECPPDERIVYKRLTKTYDVGVIRSYVIYPHDRRNQPLMRKATEWAATVEAAYLHL
jgi:DNA-binding transcriptional LysR family regulator